MAWIMSSGSARSMMSAKGSMASPRMATKAARTAACSAARCGSASTAIRAFTPAPCAACRLARARARTSGDGSCNCLICSASRAGSCKRRLTALRAAWINSSLSGRNSRPAGQIGEGRRVKLVDQGRPLAIIQLGIQEFLQESLGQLRPAGLKQQLRRVEDLRRRGRIRGQQSRNHGVFRRREVDRLSRQPWLYPPRPPFPRLACPPPRLAFPWPAPRRGLVPTRSVKSTSLRPMPSRRKAILANVVHGR